jgi:hypothetical protein
MLRKMPRRGFFRGRMAAMKTCVRRKLRLEGRIWKEQKPEEGASLVQEVKTSWKCGCAGKQES